MNKSNLDILRESLLGRLSALITLEDQSRGVFHSRVIYQQNFPYLLSDSRINFISRLLGLLFSNVEGAAPFSFRLKNLRDWRIKLPISFFLSQLSWNCKTNCLFCYQKSTPAEIKYKIRMSDPEIKTRLKYYYDGMGLITGTSNENDEVLNNPFIKEILLKVRQIDKGTIEIITNGTALTPDMIKLLNRMKPVYVFLSLNSANPAVRKWLMRDPHPQTAISAPPILKKYKIPYTASIVAWPGVPFSDIEDTICYAQKNSAHLVRIYLPGWGKYFPKKPHLNPERHWKNIIRFIQGVQDKYSIPILIVPHEYVQKVSYKRLDAPIVLGAVENSPAKKAGIKIGDVIKKINHQQTESIEEAMDLLLKNLNRSISLEVKRGSALFSLALSDKLRPSFPYASKKVKRFTPFGLLLRKNFYYLSKKDVRDVQNYIAVRRAKNVLIVTSSVIYPFLRRLLLNSNLLRSRDFKIRMVLAKNYFYGGNINSADLLVVDDFIRAIKKHVRKNRPDLILLPASPFNAWGRDLAGKINLDIEREVGIPVEFVYNQNFLPS